MKPGKAQSPRGNSKQSNINAMLLPHLPDEGFVVRGARQDVGTVAGEAGPDVEGTVDVAAEGGQRLHVRLHGVQQVVPAVAAAHQQARTCMRPEA